VRHLSPALIILTALSFALPAGAAEPPRAGGAGVHWNQAFMGHMPEGFGGGELTQPPGVLTCVGGVGFVVLKNTRVGGEGTGCFARDTGMLQVGAQIGGHLPVGETYVTVYAGLGYGRLEMELEAEYSAHFVYARPAIAIGLPLGPMAVEVGIYGVFPFAFGQQVGGESIGGSSTFPHLGLLATVLFGKHPRQRREADAVVDAAASPETEESATEPPPEAVAAD
jgi:hypothetical protein